MSMLRVVLRGIGHRPGRSVVVLVLATMATAAAVITPGYTSAAQQSLLTDTFDRLPAALAGARVMTDLRAPGDDDSDDPRRLLSVIDDRVDELDGLSLLGRPIAFASTLASVPQDAAVTGATTALRYRQDLCDHLDTVAGVCATEPGELLVSQRTAQAEEWAVGDTVVIATTGDEGEDRARYTVAGIYRPVDTSQPYWGRQSSFNFGSAGFEDFYVDSLFVDDITDLSVVDADFQIGLEYPFEVSAIRLDTVDDTIADFRALRRDTVDPQTGRAMPVKLDSSFDSMVAAVATEQEEIAASVPVVTLPLLVLSWFVFHLVMSRLIEERSPQIALAKLRGHRTSTVTGFGTGEALALLVAAVPLGTLLALLVAQLVSWMSLADGAGPSLTTDVLRYAVIALVGTAAAVLFAARNTLRGSVLGLLRSVPTRRGWRAGTAEGVLVALVTVAVWRTAGDNDDRVFALVATPLLALLVGMLTARGLEWVARRRQPSALRRGRVARALALAQLARRPETRRIVALVSVAVAVVTFGVVAWDVSDHNRDLAVADEVGADRVMLIDAHNPTEVMDAVSRIDPEGDWLMAAMRMTQRYNGRSFVTVAVQSQRLPSVVRWRDHSTRDLADLAARLHPSMDPAPTVTGELSVDATVDQVSAGRDPDLVARVWVAGKGPRLFRLGPLDPDNSRYRADLPGCATGCRLLGLGVSRYPGDFGPLRVDVTVHSIDDTSGELAVGLDAAHTWRRAWNLSDTVGMTVEPVADGLRLSADTEQPDDLLAEYVDKPDALPVSLAGDIPSFDVSGDMFTFIGPHGDLQPYTVIEHDTVVPRGGSEGMLVDLEHTIRFADSLTRLDIKTDLVYEVWAGPAAPSDLETRLSAEGLVVSGTTSYAGERERLGRQAPALALRLYLVSGGAALLLVLGVILVTVTIGAAGRGYDIAALAVAGVRRRILRGATVREMAYWLIAPTVAGVAAGGVGLALVLPSVQLVTTRPPVGPITYQAGPWWGGGALLIAFVGLMLVARQAVLAQHRHSAARRLRNSEG